MNRRLRFGPPKQTLLQISGQQDLADARAVRGEDVHAVVAVADPAGARPDVAVDVGPDAVGEARLFELVLPS